jgi:hypothetical protein
MSPKTSIRRIKSVPFDAEPVAKRRGRPPGSKNKPKVQPVVTAPVVSELAEFTVIQQFEDKIVINVVGQETPYRLTYGTFITGVIKWGFNTRGTRWPLILTETGLAVIDWNYKPNNV